MASTPSTIALFPFAYDSEDNCLQRATTVNDTLLSAIRAWLVTKKGSRLGNMVGCFLPDIINELVSSNDINAMSKQLQKDAIAQFPGVNFLDVTMSLDLSNNFVDLIVSITFSTAISDITQFQVSLPTSVNSLTVTK